MILDCLEVYEQLTSEGYLEVVRGKGTFVSLIEIKPISYREAKKEIYQPANINDVISFECGYSHILGYKPLRIEIANYLQNYKGICCSSSQIFIFSGTSDAIGFLALLFRNRCPNFIYEEFTVPFIPDIFRLHGYHMEAISVDEGGISVKELNFIL